MQILIVDDSKGMCALIRKGLAEAGFGNHTVHEAHDGAEALVKIRANVPDLVLADLNMPRLSGVDLVRILKVSNPGLPMGIITADSAAAERERLTANGVSFVLPKPFTSETLGKAVAPFLAEKR